MERNIGENIKTRTPFLARYGLTWTRKRPKTATFPDASFFTLPLGFSDGVLFQTPQKGPFLPEVPFQRS